MSKRLEILNASLARKTAKFDAQLQNHFDTVALTNGQPLNDKKNGRATLNTWHRQNDALHALQDSIQRTEYAIDRERAKIAKIGMVELPAYIQQAIDDGLITQWRRFPRFFFVTGVSGARIVLDEKTGAIAHRYLSKASQDEYPVFRDIFNSLNQQYRRSQQIV